MEKLWHSFLPSFCPPEITASTEIRHCWLVVTHHSTNHTAPQLLEKRPKTGNYYISRRNFSVASCLRQVLDLQEEVLPQGQIGTGFLSLLNLQPLQSQRSTPCTVMRCTMQLPSVRQQLPLPIELLLEKWNKTPSMVANYCCSADRRANAQWPSAATQMHTKRTRYSAYHEDFWKVTK